MGRLFVRSTWEDDATWLGYSDGEFQICDNDGVRLVQSLLKPLRLADMLLVPAAEATTFRLDGSGLSHLFLLGLRPGTDYELRIGDAKPVRDSSDPGGTLHIMMEGETGVLIRLKDLAPASKAQISVPERTGPEPHHPSQSRDATLTS
jgi:hypothetical protein